MTQISIAGDKLIAEMIGFDKLWALKSRVEVSLAHVSDARLGAGEKVRGLRMPGTHLPGVITAGTYECDGRSEFWAVHDSAQTVVIDLRDEHFSRLVLQVSDPQADVARVRSAAGLPK